MSSAQCCFQCRCVMNAIILWHPAGSRNIDPSVKLFSQSLRANMASRTPSPDYMYEGRFPTVVPDGDMDGRAAPVFFLVIYEQPLASSGRHPEELGTFLVAGANMGAPLRREVHGFVGWLLELLLLPPHRSGPLRRQLHLWQQSLQWRCQHCQLEWYQAMAVYGLALRP